MMNAVATSYFPLALFLIIAIVFAAFVQNIGILFRPHKKSAEKDMPYECGNDPVGDATGPILPRYYFFAMLLVLFDVEAIFIIPWALGADDLGLKGLVAVFLFFFVLMCGYIYLWRKGDLTWD